MLLDSDFLCFPKIYTLCSLLLFFYKIQIHEQEVVKKVKVFKKLTRHIETLQADVVMIFLESSFWNNRQYFFTHSCFALSLRLVTYVCIQFYQYFQVCLIKVEIYLYLCIFCQQLFRKSCQKILYLISFKIFTYCVLRKYILFVVYY